jgi:cytosine/adenosine deaminase-related metal-dependent hydrolase
VAPFRRMIEKGLAVGLGSDSVASNNTCDLLEEARFALLLARSQIVVDIDDTGENATHGNRCLTAHEALRVATLGGALALGREEQIGELREGLQADFAVVSLERPHQIPSYDIASTLIFASSGRDTVLTVVAGKEICRDGRVMTVDEERLRARIIEIAEKLAS